MSTYEEMLEAVFDVYAAKNIEVREPIAGLRHNRETKYVRHRFPVKGGINSAEQIYRQVSEACPLFALVRSGRL